MPTQTGTIDLRAGNAVRIATQNSIKSLSGTFIDQSKLNAAADNILASVRKEIYEVDPETGEPTSEARWASAIDLAAKGIRSSVSETYATKGDLDDEVAKRATAITQMADGITATIESTYATKDEVATLVRAYGDGVLVCKKGQTIGALINADGSFDVVSVEWDGDVPTTQGSPLTRIAGAVATFGSTDDAHIAIETVTVGDDVTKRVGFYDSEGALVAYMMDGLMYVENSMVLRTMRIGEDDPATTEVEGWQWDYESNTNLSLRWIGGDDE